MKANLFVGVLAVMATAAVANAAQINDNDSGHDRTRLYRFNFKCDFQSDHIATPTDAPTPGAPDDGSGRKCEAAATVYAYVQPNDWMNTMESTRDPMNRLAVSCNGRLVYSDSAILDPSHRRFVTITGINGLPAIYVQRKDKEEIKPDWMTYPSFLVLRDDHNRDQGTCQVQAEPVGRADADTAPALQ